MNMLIAGQENPEFNVPVDNQLHDTGYPRSPMLGSVKPSDPKRTKLSGNLAKSKMVQVTDYSAVHQ